ncbi:hypothetical protein AN958_11207 [Leucoagaricus sp. SymC.cos]|nr:hypothetical protein AN958_11207 [Leucoagaricus sp. SymC.cos]
MWAQSFRGNGRTKYAHEMLHLIHNLQNVYPPKIREIILNNWLANPSGKPNSNVELDLVQEHLNYWIKVFYKAHGSNASWEWLERISPCTDILRQLASAFHDVLGADQGTRHAEPDLTKDIEALMDCLEDYGIYDIQPGRVIKGGGPVPDAVGVGYRNLTQGNRNPLTEFNETFRELQERRQNPPVTQDMVDKLNLDELSVNDAQAITSGSSLNPGSSASKNANAITQDPLDAAEDDPDIHTGVIDAPTNATEYLIPRIGLEDVAFDMDMVEVDFPDNVSIGSDDGEDVDS